MNPGLIALVLVLFAVAAIGVIYARRAWLASRALERQLMDTRAQQAEQHQQDFDRAQALEQQVARLEPQIAGLEPQIARLREDAAARLTESGLRLTDLNLNLDDLGRGLNELDAKLASLAFLTTDVAGKIETIASAVEIVTRKPLHQSPIDSGHLETKTEKEVITLSESLATLRPLVPYPKWQFDADWANPDLAFLLRNRLWQYFSDRRREAPVAAPWHYGTRLCLYLGNDLSRQIYVAGCIDPNEFAFLDRVLQPGMTFLDAGANEGVYTVFAAARLGREGTVWAFEPSQREISRLRRNLDLNKLSPRVFPVALADRSGQAEMSVAGFGHEGLNTLGTFVHEIEESRKEVIQLARLDDVISENPLPRLDVIKIDVEGAELKLLHGAAATLQRYRPLILFEASDRALKHQGSSREELLEYLRGQDYELYFFDPYSGLPAPATAGAYSDNMIAAPAGLFLPEAVYLPWPIAGESVDERD
jgi:FkbM family methyltransferase